MRRLGPCPPAPRPVSAPWHDEAIGCAEWTGTPLRGVLEEAELLDDAVELVFTGQDRGFDQGVEQDYQRSLSIEDAMAGDVLLAYAMNGQPLPPSHGFPLRLIVPEWYGMASVKWLRSITAITEPFEGVQQTLLTATAAPRTKPGTPVTRKQPRALMAPPGIPEFLSRTRHVRAGRTLLQGRAGRGPTRISRVEFSADGGRTWDDALLEERNGSTAGAPGPMTGTRASRRLRALRPRDRQRRQRPAARQRRNLEPGRLCGQRRPARGRPRQLAQKPSDSIACSRRGSSS